jgi:hypothetical protein
MLSPPTHREIDHRTIKLLVGAIAISIGPLTCTLAKTRITSISASYYEAGWAQSIFIGFLFAVAALLLAYNGYSTTEMILSKVAAGAGLGVALFPCGCDTHTESIPYVHEIFATAMFLILAYFCYGFFRRARDKQGGPAKARTGIYAVCGLAIILAILVLTFNGLADNAVQKHFSRVIFYGEFVALVAFGVSWLTASRVIPVITSKEERFSPFRANNPP